MIKNNKKEVFVTLLIILILSITSIICTYSISKSKSKDKANLYLKMTGDRQINITNKLPMSDELGKSIDESDDMKAYVNFSIKNTSDEDLDYDIYIVKDNSKSTIKNSYVKFYLTDISDTALDGFTNNMLPNYDDLLSLSDKPAGKLLYSGTIRGKTKENYKLRVWLSDTYAINTELERFNAKLSVKVK